jgi:hypothetical protein
MPTPLELPANPATGKYGDWQPDDVGPEFDDTLPGHVYVYTGAHYGCRHKVISRHVGHNTITALHETSGDVITAHASDCDPA